LIALWIATALLAKARGQKGRSEYEAVTPLTEAEKEFYKVLTGLYGTSVLIWPKVRLLDLVRPRKTLDRSTLQIAKNRVSSKHVDFVLVRPEDLTILGVIELDGRTHDRPSNQDRDALVDNALTQAAIPICRIKSRRNYDPILLAKQITAAFEPGSR
jgi:very-short-patch-repair endonuclease